MEKKRCFVSMPFGKKTDPYTGRNVDFDLVFEQLVKPAAEEAGYTTLRADQFTNRTVAGRALLEQLLLADVFVADLSIGSANVAYEVGLRHALTNATTLLICEADSTDRVPFDLSYVRLIAYRAVGSEFDPAARTLLAGAIRQGVGWAGSTSPVYQLLPNLRPPELVEPQGQDLTSMGSRKTELASSEPPIEMLREAEQEIRSTGTIDVAAVLEVMKGYQVRSAWEDLVKFSADLPENTKEVPHVVQMTALALNRLGRSEDAIGTMQALVARTGGDSESYSILGRIFKSMYLSERQPEYVEQATESYRRALRLAPNDHYAGLNLASLLALYAGDEGKEELDALVPHLREQLAQRIKDPRADFWDISAALELAVIARDWWEAARLATRLVSTSEAQWMLAATANQLMAYVSTMPEPVQAQLELLVGLVQGSLGVTQRNA